MRAFYAKYDLQIWDAAFTFGLVVAIIAVAALAVALGVPATFAYASAGSFALLTVRRAVRAAK